MIDSKLILLLIKNNYINIKYINSPKIYQFDILTTFIESYIKTNGFNFSMIAIFKPELFKTKNFVKLCIDKGYCNYIINLIDDSILTEKIIIYLINNNCYNKRIEDIIKTKSGLKAKLKENILLEKLTDDLLYLFDLDNITDIIRIIKSKKINLIKKIQKIKDINSSIDYTDTYVEPIIVELVDKGLLGDIIRFDLINTKEFLIFLKKINQLDKLDKKLSRKLNSQLFKDLYNT